MCEAARSVGCPLPGPRQFFTLWGEAAVPELRHHTLRGLSRSHRKERENGPMKQLLVLFACTAALAGCSQTLSSEPGAGTLAYGATVLVDDGSCAEGQIKQVTGGDNTKGIPRKRECVARS